MEKYKFLYRRSATAIILVELKTGVRQLWTTKSTDGETFELNGLTYWYSRNIWEDEREFTIKY